MLGYISNECMLLVPWWFTTGWLTAIIWLFSLPIRILLSFPALSVSLDGGTWSHL